MAFTPQFNEVSRSKMKASIVIQGLSGYGKSGLALALAYAFAHYQWDKVYALDTENRSLNLFDGLPMHTGEKFRGFRKFDLTKVHGYRPTHYLAAKEAAKRNGAEVFVEDSISHMWNGPGGVLQLVSQKEAENARVNKFNAWGVPEVVTEKDTIFELIRDAEIHLIATVRVKEKFDLVAGEGVKSRGEQQIQMPDLKFEPDLVLEMLEAGTTSGQAPRARVIKSRYAVLAKDEIYEFTKERIDELVAYLEEGADPAIMMEAQRQEYIAEIKSILDGNPSKAVVWTVYKSDAGCADIALPDMTLPILRKLLSQLIQ